MTEITADLLSVSCKDNYLKQGEHSEFQLTPLQAVLNPLRDALRLTFAS